MDSPQETQIQLTKLKGVIENLADAITRFKKMDDAVTRCFEETDVDQFRFMLFRLEQILTYLEKCRDELAETNEERLDKQKLDAWKKWVEKGR